MSESQLCTMNLWTIVQWIQMYLVAGPRHSSPFQYLVQAIIHWLVEIFVKYFQSWVCIKMACLVWPDGKQERWENQLLILHPASRHSCTWMRLPLGILWAEQSQLSCESPSIILVGHCWDLLSNSIFVMLESCTQHSKGDLTDAK